MAASKLVHASESRLPESSLPLAGVSTAPAVFIRGVLAACYCVDRCYLRWQQRQHLRELSEHQLRDVGITRSEARIESSQPFWR